MNPNEFDSIIVILVIVAAIFGWAFIERFLWVCHTLVFREEYYENSNNCA